MTGKEKCKYLKQIRAAVAEDYKIEGFEYQECPFTGDCYGTCPACDMESQLLYNKLKELGLDIDAEAIKETERELFPKKNIEPIYIDPIPDTPGVMWIPPDDKETINHDMISGKVVRKPNNDILGKMNKENYSHIAKKDNSDNKPRGLRNLFKKNK